jgi:tetratricopeptide (TPR) repeat protein
MPDKNLTYAQRYYQSALDFFDQGQYSKALEHIHKAIEKSPQSADYFSTKGIFLHKMNDLAQAIEAYRRALELNPGHTFSHFNLGLIFMKLGKTIEAIQEWEAVIKVNPTDVNAIFNIAVSLGQIGRRKEAIQFYERVLQIQPNHVQTHQNLGILYRDEKQYEKAKNHLNKLKHLDSTYSEVVTVEIGKCNEMEFLEKTSFLDAAKIAHELMTRHPEGLQLGDALSACIDGNYSEALKIVDTILQQNPADSGARILRGQCLASLSRNDEAIVEFMGILAENPTIADVHFQLGNIFLNMGESEKALEHFERVKRLDPSFPIIDENIFNLKQLVAKK